MYTYIINAIQNSAQGEAVNPEIVVYQDVSNRYELLLKVCWIMIACII